MIDSSLAYTLRTEALYAAIEISRLMQKKNISLLSLQELTWTLRIYFRLESEREFCKQGFEGLFLNEVLKTLGNESATFEEVRVKTLAEVENLELVLAQDPGANLDRGQTFCLKLHEEAGHDREPMIRRLVA